MIRKSETFFILSTKLQSFCTFPCPGWPFPILFHPSEDDRVHCDSKWDGFLESAFSWILGSTQNKWSSPGGQSHFKWHLDEWRRSVLWSFSQHTALATNSWRFHHTGKQCVFARWIWNCINSYIQPFPAPRESRILTILHILRILCLSSICLRWSLCHSCQETTSQAVPCTFLRELLKDRILSPKLRKQTES